MITQWDNDQRYMAIALQLAKQGRYTVDPNPCVGCVLVKNQKIVGTGYHQRAGDSHAECVALNAAGAQAYGATAYVTLEPCCHQGRTPPCVDALIAAGIQRVVVAMQDPNPLVAGQGLAALQAAGIEIKVGVQAVEARMLNPGFIQRYTLNKPLVRLKLAMSLDGRTALANGESQWITGVAARKDVQHWRALSSAIITGIGTVLADDPALTVRPAELPKPVDAVRQPLRVVLDSQARLSDKAQMLSLPGSTLVVVGSHTAQTRQQTLQHAGAEVLALPVSATNRIPLEEVLQQLVQREVHTVLLECGPTLAGAALQAGIVDELIAYLAPCLLGNQARGLVHLPNIQHLADCLSFELSDHRMIGKDVRLIFKPS